MIMPTLKSSIAAVLAAALLLSSIGFDSAEARSRRHHSRANAAAVAAVLGVFGTIAALAARDRYRDRYYYYGPGPYYGPPYTYYPPRRYRYRHRNWHRHGW
jgi:hypothetical protein